MPLVSRTKFYYYALEFEPFLIICIVLCLGLILGSAGTCAGTQSSRVDTRRRLRPCVLMMFWYFYPILAGKVIPYSDWLQHMWYRMAALDLRSPGIFWHFAPLAAYQRFLRVQHGVVLSGTATYLKAVT